MHHSIFYDTDTVLPDSVKKAATESLPAFLSTEETQQIRQHALQIAYAFHASETFKSIFETDEKGALYHQQNLITSFEKNVRLLVEKTWVDTSNAEFKDDILYRIKIFCASMHRSGIDTDYTVLFPECIAVLRDVVLLLFGQQINSNNFLEYAVRIDPDFGLFWYYIECCTDIKVSSPEKLRIAILLGVCFLANF